MFTDLPGTQLIANYVLFDDGGFFLRSGDALTNLRWGDLGYCYAQQRSWGGDCDGIVMERVRYDSPTIAGFSVSGSWSENDDWNFRPKNNSDFNWLRRVAPRREVSEVV